MNKKIRHYNWKVGEEGGRIAIAVVEGTLKYRVLAGNNPPPGLLEQVLLNDLELLTAAHIAHAGRKHRWQIEKSVCSYGSETYRLRLERDPEFRDYPIAASLHITCNRKLPFEGRFWIGDIIPLLMAAGFLGITPTGVDLWEVPMWEPGEWQTSA